MRYKVEPIPGMPDWLKLGIWCRVRNYTKAPWKFPVQLTGVLEEYGKMCFLDLHGNVWRYAEPVEEWEPQLGEYCAFFNSNESAVIILKYGFRDDLNEGHRPSNQGASCWRHVARLQYPDGRLINCICSVKELLERTEWI